MEKKGLILADDGSDKIFQIDILLGADHYWTVILPEAPLLGKPTLVPSIFGYLTHGKIGTQEVEDCTFAYHVRDEPLLDENVENLWKLDAIGINEEEQDLKLDVRKVNGRYQAKLPWLGEDRPTCNLKQAEKRMQIVLKNMSKEEKEEYSEYVNDLEQNEVIEKVDKNDMKFILPHFAIRREGKRIRVVFDAKAGLNQFLAVGPNMLQELIVVLIQSRFWKFLCQGDVKAAFHQVVVEEADRDFLCLLWENQTYRFSRLPFGLNCSPAILNESLSQMRQEYQTSFPEIVTKLETATYVDDVCSGGQTKEERNEFVGKSHHMFENSGFNLTKWKFSNEVDNGENPVGSNLGIFWNRDRDIYSINVGSVVPLETPSEKQVFTRRKLVSSVAKVYDPLGICSPWTLRGRIFIQDSWKSNKGWDERVDNNIETEWKRWIQEASEIPCVEFPRYVSMDENSSLHFFSDASEIGYAAVCYVVTNNQVYLLYGRSRVAPLKRRTIPELELMGTVLSIRLTRAIKYKIPFLKDLKVTYWTDSTIALQWIRNEELRLKVFVRNRVQEIRQVEGEWRHCPGELNPADGASRGTSLKELVNHKLYWSGPPFLIDRSSWPSIPIISEEDEQSVMVAVEEKEDEVENLNDEPMTETLFDLSNRRISLRRIALRTAYVMRFVHNITSTKNSHPRITGPLKKEDVEIVKDWWIRKAQYESFEKEIDALKNGKEIPKNSPLSNHRATWNTERNLLMGQPRNGEPPCPIIHASSSLCLPIFIDAHEQVFHGGPQATLMKVREKFHVIRGRVLSKSVVKGCQKCKRYRCLPSGSEEGSLPTDRTSPARPFSVIGIDFFGPLFIGDEKKWVLLITCGVIRAIHMELVDSQSEEDVSLAMRRFVARRGLPSTIYSDNAKTYVKLAKSFPAKWNFIPEKAPWHGGFYERMVGVVKTHMKIVLHGVSLSRIVLETIIFEIEAAVNSRPLTSISCSDVDLLPLTPNHFLYGVAPENDTSVLNSQNENFVPGKQWRLRLKIAQDFWNRFKKEYLTTLRDWRRKTHGPYQVLNPGDIVLVQGGKMTPRSKWNLARIIELDDQADGPFSAKILLGSGETTRRPMVHLYPIECGVGTESLKIENYRKKVQEEQDNEIIEQVEEQVEIEPVMTRAGRRVRRAQRSEYDYD